MKQLYIELNAMADTLSSVLDELEVGCEQYDIANAKWHQLLHITERIVELTDYEDIVKWGEEGVFD